MTARLGTSAGARRFAIAVVVLVVVAAGLATYAARRTHGATARTVLLTPGAPFPATYDAPAGPQPAGTNEATARAEVTRLLDGLSMPAGTHRLAAAPAPRLRRSGAMYGPQARSPWPARWYVTPGTATQARTWLRSHPQRGLTTTGRLEGGMVTWEGTATTSYTQPIVIFTVAALPSGATGIRAEVELAPRFDRTAATMAPTGVTSAVVSQVSVNGGAVHAQESVTDPGTLATIISAYDALPGAPDAMPGPVGSLPGAPVAYAVTFRSPRHTLVVGADNPYAGRGHPLALDGRALPQQLDYSSTYDELLLRVLKDSPQPGPQGATEEAAHEAAARAEAERLLDLLAQSTAMTDARVVGTAPSPMLAQPALPKLGVDPSTRLTATRFWAVPHSRADALVAALRATPPLDVSPAMSSLHSTSGPGVSGQALAPALTWLGQQGTADYAYPEVSVTLVQDGSSVDVRADVQISWRPTRPAASYVAGTVSTVTVTSAPYREGRPAPPTHTVTITGAQVNPLVTLVNGLDAEVPQGPLFSCPASTPPSMAMTFRSDAGTWTFASPTSCQDDVLISRDGRDVGDVERGVFRTTVEDLLAAS